MLLTCFLAGKADLGVRGYNKFPSGHQWTSICTRPKHQHSTHQNRLKPLTQEKNEEAYDAQHALLRSKSTMEVKMPKTNSSTSWVQSCTVSTLTDLCVMWSDRLLVSSAKQEHLPNHFVDPEESRHAKLRCRCHRLRQSRGRGTTPAPHAPAWVHH